MKLHRLVGLAVLCGASAAFGCGGSDGTTTTPPGGDDTGTTGDTGGADTDPADTDPGDTATPDTDPGDTGTTDTGTTDTDPGDTGTTDTGTTDTDPGDTGAPDTDPGDTGSVDTTVPDTTPTDTAPADTFVPDTTTPDTTVTDTGPGDTGAVDTGPDVGPPPTITTVTISGQSDREVRQGLGAFTMNVTGTNLSGATSATVSGTGVTCTVSSSTSTTAGLACNVAHGSAFTERSLTITTPAGTSAPYASAVIVTRITVYGTTGNDTTGRGTTSSPFKTVSKGLSVALTNATFGPDTVFIRTMGDGSTTTINRYTAASGESWPTLLGTTANVPNGIIVEGEGTGATRAWLGGSATTVALRFAGSATVRNLNIIDFATAAAASSGTVTLQDVDMRATGDVVTVSGTGALTVRSASGAEPTSTVTRPTCVLENTAPSTSGAGDALTTTSSGAVSVIGCWVRGATQYGVYKTGTGDLTLDNAWVFYNGNDGDDYGVYASGGGTVTVLGGDIFDNYAGGLYVTGTTNLVIRSANVTRNGIGSGKNVSSTYIPTTANAGISIVGSGAFTMGLRTGSTTRSFVRYNGYGGIRLVTTGGTTQSLQLDNVTIEYNRSNVAELFVSTLGQLRVRNTTISALALSSGSNYGAVRIESQPNVIDFGTSTSSAGNVLRSEGTAAQPVFIDARPGLGSSCTNFLAPSCNLSLICGTTLNGSAPAASIVSGGPTYGPTTGTPPVAIYYIANSNRRIGFCQ